MKTDTLQKVELAEGVEIGLRVAGPAVRALAWLIDFSIGIGILIGIAIIIAALSSIIGENVANGVMMLSFFLLNWFYFAWFEWGKRGATPGKRAMGLRVVRTSGAPISIAQAIIRNLLRAVDILPPPYGIGLVSCTATKRFQRLGDLAADTLVIYENDAQSHAAVNLPQVKAQPPKVRLTREEQQAVIMFGERAPTWSDSRKEEVADCVEELTGAKGREGVIRLFSMGRWIQES